MDRITSALLRALLTASLMTTAACVSELEESSTDPAEKVVVDSEPIKIGDVSVPAEGLVLQHREIIQVDQAGNEQHGFVASSYSASSTNSATVNTVNYNVVLYANDTFTIGTCGVSGATSSGDTYLRFYNPVGAQVAVSDDACGLASKIVYTALTTGTYQLRAGCYAGGSCGGTLAYSYSAPLFSYSASNTNNATVNTTNISLGIGGFNLLRLGTCGIPGASGASDTYLRLYNASNTLVAANDDSCGGLLSQMVIPGGALPPGTYSLRAGCFSNGSCSGTVAYYVE